MYFRREMHVNRNNNHCRATGSVGKKEESGMNQARIFPQRLFPLLLCFVAFRCMAALSADNSSDLTDHYRRMMIYHERIDGSIPQGAVLFIGDSITQGLCVAAVCDRAVNFGIGSDTTVGVLHRLPRYHAIERASAVVVAIGVNDLRRRDDAVILENMEQIIRFISARAPLIISAVMPVDERVESVGQGRNERITALNKKIAELCTEHTGCIFVDVSEALTDEEDNLAAHYHVGDGVHLNTAGYAYWIESLGSAVAWVQDQHGKHAQCAQVPHP